MGKLTVIPIAEIRENPVALRAVNQEDERYLGLVESIREKGFMGAITVRPKQDAETGQDYYELVDGLHRFAASKDAGLSEINVDIVELDDDQTLEAQIMANIHKVETRPIEYTKQLVRILSRNPLMTEAELAQKLGKSTAWIADRLGLAKIANQEIQTLVDEGKIRLANAYAMAKLPPEEMVDFVERAMTLGPDEFVPAVQLRVKEIREAKRQGRSAGESDFQPTAHLQKMKDIKDEQESGEIAAILCKGLTSAASGFKMAIDWVLHVDPMSIEGQKSKFDQRVSEREDARKKRAIEQAKKKEEKAQKAADEARKAQEELAATEAEAEG